MRPEEPQDHSRWSIAIGAFLAVALFLSVYLACNRIYQVDECQNVYIARILASGWSGQFAANIELFHLWPLSWIAGMVTGSSNLYLALRLVMLLVFWLNIVLTAWACGVSWRHRSFPWILLGAATLAPLWDYGFEIRHDNILLLVLLLYWNVLRGPRLGWKPRAVGLGALVAVMQFVTFKAFVYWIPLSVLFLAFPDPRLQAGRPRILAFWLLGCASAAAALLLCFLWKGELHLFLASFGSGLGYSTSGQARFYPWMSLGRLVNQTPLLSALAVAAFAAAARRLLGPGWAARVWDGAVPEAVLFAAALGMLCVNPAPYPYNLVLLVPFGFILGVRWFLGTEVFRDLSLRGWLGAGFCLLLFTHLLPFGKSVLRHLDWPNDRQEKLMNLAEAMTDPARDRVYDASGLVASRKSAGRQWFLHSLLVNDIREGRLPTLKQTLEANPAVVLIPNYRFTWLLPEDIAFIQANYIELSSDYLVLGTRLQGSPATFHCLWPGRYFIAAPGPGGAPGNLPVLLDGKPVPVPAAIPLTKGDHVFSFAPGQAPAVGWIGPDLSNLPSLDPGDFRSVFTNWY